jgi:polysaccharide deacetylase 2 family uncharacterized protein YibQ
LAKKATEKPAGSARRKRRVSALSATVVLLVCAAAGAIGWASLTYEAPGMVATPMAQEEKKPPANSKTEANAATPAEQSASAESPAAKMAAEPQPTKTEFNNDSIVALSPVPDPDLVRITPNGALPKVDAKGRSPRQVYARPFTPDEKPLVAIVVTGLGLNDGNTRMAINELPPAVTLAFSPYGRDLQRLINMARGRGHEAMLELPMEPDGYPNNDSGPWSLLATAPARINLLQAEKSMVRFTGYFGVVNAMGGAFTQSDNALRPIFQLLRQSGLMFLDRRSSTESVAVPVADSMNLPRAYVNHWLDQEPTVAAIEKRLADLRKTAETEGYAIGLTELYPNSANLVTNWAKNAGAMGLSLAPVSAITNKQGRP